MKKLAFEDVHPGDVVRRNDDETLMTVEHKRDDGKIVCVWFDNKDELHEAVFSLEDVTLESPEP